MKYTPITHLLQVCLNILCGCQTWYPEVEPPPYIAVPAEYDVQGRVQTENEWLEVVVAIVWTQDGGTGEKLRVVHHHLEEVL